MAIIRNYSIFIFVLFCLLDGNRINEIQPLMLSKLSSLKQLKLGFSKRGNQIIELSSMKKCEMPCLQWLCLDSNQILSISPLIDCKLNQLNHLYLCNNHITSIDYLIFSNIPKLKALSVAGNYLTNTLFLTKIQLALQYINLQQNQITEVNSLFKSNLKKLEKINICENLLSNEIELFKCHLPNISKMKYCKITLSQTINFLYLGNVRLCKCTRLFQLDQFNMNDKTVRLSVFYQDQKYLIIPINTMRNSYKRIDLPCNYAQILLDRQIAVALSIEPLQDNICALLELYSKGFEYYQSLGSYKYKFFDLKMKEIFMKKQNDENKVKNQQAISIKSKQEVKAVCLQQSKSVLQKNKYLVEVQNETKTSTNTQSLQKIFLLGQYKLIEVNMKMKHEIDYQLRLLQQKLQARHQKVIKNNQESNKLKQNSTKTSLVSQSEHKKNIIGNLSDHIFQQQLLQNDEQTESKHN